MILEIFPILSTLIKPYIPPKGTRFTIFLTIPASFTDILEQHFLYTCRITVFTKKSGGYYFINYLVH